MMKKHEAIAPDLSERIMNEGDGFAGVTLAQRLERLLPTGAQFFVDGGMTDCPDFAMVADHKTK